VNSDHVVDASVAAKWFLVEEGMAEADILSRSGMRLIAPSFVLVELSSIIWKHSLRGVFDADQAAQIMLKAPHFFDELVAESGLLGMALDLACMYRHPVYDCLYLALALERDCRLVTADHKFIERMKATPLAGHVVPLAGFAA
jgi:predicted nucleic acid-binding protein